MQKNAVLIIGFGAPAKLEEIPQFLQNVVRGQKVPQHRLDEVVSHYKDIGGGSPFNKLTFQQADALRAELARRRLDLPVYVGMRNWHPYLKDVVVKMADDGIQNAITIIMATHQGPASWGRYQIALAMAMQTLGRRVIPSVNVEPWFDHPGFIEAQAARAEEVLVKMSPEQCADAAYIFTAHSVPVDPTSPYECQIYVTARLVAARLGIKKYSIAYQSRSGNPTDQWLEPDVLSEITKLAKDGAKDFVLIPIGFICDHVEVLYDLDIEARKHCESLAVHYHRAQTVTDHPSFIRALADLVQAKCDAF